MWTRDNFLYYYYYVNTLLLGQIFLFEDEKYHNFLQLSSLVLLLQLFLLFLSSFLLFFIAIIATNTAIKGRFICWQNVSSVCCNGFWQHLSYQAFAFCLYSHRHFPPYPLNHFSSLLSTLPIWSFICSTSTHISYNHWNNSNLVPWSFLSDFIDHLLVFLPFLIDLFIYVFVTGESHTLKPWLHESDVNVRQMCRCA